ncbi:MAG: hypothetical protein HY582_00255 [Candidatus Omnitrophica bacterium]|nr:hypothetical protein [Candidatus Omnitrophota bacterium]
MEPEKKLLYFDLEKHDRDTVVGYLLNTLLRARAACRMSSNTKGFFDEDVNIYLAHLLLASALPDYQELTHRYLALNSSELLEAVEQSEDKVLRYFIYKVNADYLLVHLGIFNDLTVSSSHPFHKSERSYIEMGQSYYNQASQCNQLIYRKHTAVGDVLDKLSNHFENYKRILEAIREDFFQLVQKMGSEELESESGGAQLAQLVRVLEREHKLNEFLDVYSTWLATKSVDLLPKLKKLAQEIKVIDPEFEFPFESVPQLLNGKGIDGKKETNLESGGST